VFVQPGAGQGGVVQGRAFSALRTESMKKTTGSAAGLRRGFGGTL
jgi:hypothetical protein